MDWCLTGDNTDVSAWRTGRVITHDGSQKLLNMITWNYNHAEASRELLNNGSSHHPDWNLKRWILG